MSANNHKRILSTPAVAATKFVKIRLIILFCLIVTSRCLQADSLDTWTSQASGTTNNLNAIIYAAPTFVAVGNGGAILTSTNGADWVNQNAVTPLYNLYGVTCANGLFVAVGQGPIRTSTDGITWSHYVAPLGVLHGVACGNGLFVAVGENGTIGTSTDGTNWVAQNSGTNTLLTSLAYGDGRFCCTAGYSGKNILTSTNGTNWSSVNLASNVPGFWGTTFGQNKFVVVGGEYPVAHGGSIAASPDGTTWFAQNSGIIWANFYGITWGNGSFVAVGGNGFIGSGYTNRIILTSSDSSSWVVRLADTNSLLAGVAYGNGSFVAVGSRGAILQSGPIFTLAGENQLINGGFQLDLTGEIGRRYRIQTSTNLADINWTDLVSFTNITETMQFFDTDATNISRRFYRAVSP